MPKKLDGRKILVTGAASGMGRGIAQRFASEGAAMALLDRNGDGVREVEDVARAALFFTAEDSSFTTGAWMPVDGGFAWR